MNSFFLDSTNQEIDEICFFLSCFSFEEVDGDQEERY
uniref:Uncharacterized protein n=1 Tax=Nelumbo nucifera TaxID=4432 RepID=A0A822Z542_NELNU|nr:TPA_asm: hypothetical protein HUJ06_009140 [Nelumbo nucifera]